MCSSFVYLDVMHIINCTSLPSLSPSLFCCWGKTKANLTISYQLFIATLPIWWRGGGGLIWWFAICMCAACTFESVIRALNSFFLTVWHHRYLKLISSNIPESWWVERSTLCTLIKTHYKWLYLMDCLYLLNAFTWGTWLCGHGKSSVQGCVCIYVCVCMYVDVSVKVCKWIVGVYLLCA